MVSWRTELERYASYYNLKDSRLIPQPHLQSARARLETAKSKLQRFGDVHIAGLDQRGKKPLPPAGIAKGLYYAFLCLFDGLKQEFSARSAEGAPNVRETLVAIVRKLGTAPHTPDSFFVYIAWAGRLLDELKIGEQTGLTADNLLNLVGPRSQKPSETALELTAQVFDVSARTIERLKDTAQIIPWATSAGELYAIGGRPNFDLSQFPEALQVLRSADLQK